MAHVADNPIPEQGESFERFTVRAHKALLKCCPDPDERNAAVERYWRQAGRELPGESIAAKHFTPDKFEHSAGHCVFVEHETVGKDGKPRKYDLTALKKIVQQHNREISDLSAFPAIAEHHTPDKGDPSGKEPDTIGFAGPFRLGMVGRDEPKWAIFADEHRRKDAAAVDLFSRKPFRSVELWTFKDGTMRFHPIAVVGAEAPRLIMPAKYTQDAAHDECFAMALSEPSSFTFEGADVERYTVATAAMPGGGNTFTKEPVKYEQPQQPLKSGGVLSPQDIAAIMAALAETPEFVYLRRQMQEDEATAGEDDPSTGAGDEFGEDDFGDDFGDEADDADMQATADEEMEAGAEDFGEEGDDEPPGLSDEQAGPPEGEDDDKPKKEPFTMTAPAAVSVEKFTQLQTSHNAVVEKYTALQASHEELIGKYAKVHERLATVEKVGTDATRKAKLGELVGKYSLVLDRDEEEKACLYSQGSTMTDEEFDRHVATIEKYGEKFTSSPMLPRGVMPERLTQNQTSAEKYEQRLAEEALKYHSEQLGLGKQVAWSEAEAEAAKRIKNNGHAAAAA